MRMPKDTLASDNRANLVVRVSKKDKAEGYSMAAQEKLEIDYCERSGLVVHKIYRIPEAASSGKQRVLFKQALIETDADKVKHLVGEKTDRLTRNLRDSLIMYDWLDADPERRLHSIKGGIVLHKNSRSQEKLP
jgi:DNA invertase Pin-like site-specific DNA recombinase